MKRTVHKKVTFRLGIKEGGVESKRKLVPFTGSVLAPAPMATGPDTSDNVSKTDGTQLFSRRFQRSMRTVPVHTNQSLRRARSSSDERDGSDVFW